VAYVPPHGFRTFLIVWATQSISVIGSALTLFATTIWLSDQLYPLPEQKPELSLALAALSLAFAVPMVFVAPIAGAWADRHDRKQIMVIADVANGCLSLLLAALLLTHSLGLWMLIGLMLLFSTLGSFHSSAFDTSYAMIVPEQQLARANGMMQTMWALSGILAPGIAALLIALPTLARQGVLGGPMSASLGGLDDGTPLAIAVDAISFFGAALVLLFLHIPSPVRTDLVGGTAGPRPSLWADVREGALYIWDRRPLLWLLGTFTVVNLTGSPVRVFQPLLVKFDLIDDWTARGLTFEAALALLATVSSMGGVAGGVLITAWGGLRVKRVYGVLVPMIVAGSAQIVFGLSRLLVVSSAMALVMSAMLPILNAHSQAIWQTQTPRELQGRVFAVRRVIAQCTWPLSTALAGVAGGLFDPGLVLAALGVVCTLFCVAQLFNPYLRRVEDKQWLEQLATQRGKPLHSAEHL
jgi:MFS family permease